MVRGTASKLLVSFALGSGAIAIAACTANGNAVAPAHPIEGTATKVLTRGDVLRSGDRLVDPRGSGYLEMRRDGDLVLFDANGSAVWSTGTAGNPGAFAALQSDGNFIVFGTSGAPLWQSETTVAGGFGKTEFVDVAERRLVLYNAHRLNRAYP